MTGVLPGGVGGRVNSRVYRVEAVTGVLLGGVGGRVNS